MMLAPMIEQFADQLNEQLPQWREVLEHRSDLGEVERALLEVIKGLYREIIQRLVQERLDAPGQAEVLDGLAGHLGRRYKGRRRVRIQVLLGVEIEVEARYYAKAPSKRQRAKGRRGKGRRGKGTGRGAYLGLEVLGIRGRCSGQWLGEVVELALLCPSLAVACQVLERRGVKMDVNRLRRLCRELSWWGCQGRGRNALTDLPDKEGLRLVIALDGGRLRQRRPKRGRRGKGKKRQGYEAPWREPRQIVLYLIDADGQIVKDFPPLYDATLSDRDGTIWLLEQYLDNLDVDQFDQIVVCADGATWIGKAIDELCQRRGWSDEKVTQVLDYTHAKQNLQLLVDLLPEAQRAEAGRQWHEWLWHGHLGELERDIKRRLRGNKRQQALKKFQDYFQGNAKRLRYAEFKARNLPCGSGAVESAIRRVINLRLKGPGVFWTAEMAEAMLFLRSQLLSGRWTTFLANVTGDKARQLADLTAANEAIYTPEEGCADAA